MIIIEMDFMHRFEEAVLVSASSNNLPYFVFHFFFGLFSSLQIKK